VNALRAVIGALGLGGAAYGVVALLDLGAANLRDVATWLVGGVVLHDGLVAPATIAVGFLVGRVWRGRPPAAVVVGALVLGTATLVAVPVLGRFGARADNPTLLDRNYVLGWLVLATLTVVVSGVAALVLRKGGADGASAGRR
jgi:hypothetical protein